MTLTTPPQGLAEAIVEGIFADLRDRRFLKWLFGRPGSAEMVTRDVERLTDDTQEEIAEAWRNIVIAHVSPLLEERDAEIRQMNDDRVAIFKWLLNEAGMMVAPGEELDAIQRLAATRDARIKALEGDIKSACDLLAERKHGHAARSPAHNARTVLEHALVNPGHAQPNDLDARAAALASHILDDDHLRGCQGREYDCTCGYDAKTSDHARALLNPSTVEGN